MFIYSKRIQMNFNLFWIMHPTTCLLGCVIQKRSYCTIFCIWVHCTYYYRWCLWCCLVNEHEMRWNRDFWDFLTTKLGAIDTLLVKLGENSHFLRHFAKFGGHRNSTLLTGLLLLMPLDYSVIFRVLNSF